MESERYQGIFGLQEILESKLADICKDGTLDEGSDDLEATIANMVPDLADTIADDMLSTINESASSVLKEHESDRRAFEERLGARWKKPLDLLDLLIALAIEAGDTFNSKFRNDAVVSNDAVFEALTRLHARACQVASEVFTLLRSGYADGAHARWRSIHEIAVIGMFIIQNDPELAEKYLLHDSIQRYKLALRLQEYAERINTEPLSQEELDDLKSRRNELVGQFGKSFGSDYGWASSVVGRDSPAFSDIERQVDMDHMRPYYRMTSDNVHANAHATYYRLGLSFPQDKVLLVGPSNMGLADPGHGTAISLHQITVALFRIRPSLDSIVVMKILQKLQDEIGQAFLEVHQELEALASLESQDDEATIC